MTETPPPPPPLPGHIATLALRERYREDHVARHDPIADERLLWRAQTVRHLLHLTPGQTILELGCGDMRFTRRLVKVSRGENPIVAATFQSTDLPDNVPEAVEWVRLEALPGELAGRQFDCVVARDLLDARDCATVLSEALDLLAPGGQIVLFESNPWNPWLKLKRFARRFTDQDPRSLLSRPRLYELLSEIGFIRIFAVYTDFVYSPLSPRLIWLLRNLSVVAENARGLSRFAGTILVHGQKPPRVVFRPTRPLCDHPGLAGAVSVVIPCHNEEMNIGPLIDRLLSLYGD
jgi:dolichol-phosphate mannosyltransferase